VAKFIHGDDKVVVNGRVLSDHAFAIDTPSEKEQVDVSGFSPTATREYLPGLAEQTIEVSFLQDFGTNSVHQTLEPLYRTGTTFPMFVQPDSDAGTSAANPIYGGTASLYEYNGLSGELNSRAEVVAVFKPAPGSSFAWGTVAP
jgi:hypothetical protein